MKSSILALTVVLSSLVGCGGGTDTQCTNKGYVDAPVEFLAPAPYNDSFYSEGGLPSHGYIYGTNQEAKSIEYNFSNNTYQADFGNIVFFGSFKQVDCGWSIETKEYRVKNIYKGI